MEYVIVKFPESRTVLIDGEEGGLTGRILLVEKGTHLFQLNDPQDYQPPSNQQVVANTTFVKPLEVRFEKV
jgi:hypothetical protein